MYHINYKSTFGYKKCNLFFLSYFSTLLHLILEMYKNWKEFFLLTKIMLKPPVHILLFNLEITIDENRILKNSF